MVASCVRYTVAGVRLLEKSNDVVAEMVYAVPSKGAVLWTCRFKSCRHLQSDFLERFGLHCDLAEKRDWTGLISWRNWVIRGGFENHCPLDMQVRVLSVSKVLATLIVSLCLLVFTAKS